MNPSWQQYKSWLGDEVTHWPQGIDSLPPIGPKYFQTDSRSLDEGSCFVPIVGETFDGHSYIDAAFKAGAKSCLCQEDKRDTIDEAYKDFAIGVKDSLRAFQLLAKGWLELVSPRNSVAVVGSVGKTTCKAMLRCIVKDNLKSHCASGSFNNEIGVPKTILEMAPETEALVLEFGARHEGDIKYLCDLYQPNIRITLNVFPVHLEEFGDMETIYRTKTEGIRDSGGDFTAIALADDPKILKALSPYSGELVTFGESRDATWSIVENNMLEDGTQFIAIEAQGSRTEITLPVAHTSYALNLAASMACAAKMGIDSHAVSSAMANFLPEDGRFKVETQNGIVIIDDSYNASPPAMRAGLQSCQELFPEHGKIAILGDMYELGDEAESLHEEIGAFCQNTLNPKAIVTVGRFGNSYAKGAKSAGLSEKNISHYDSVDKIEGIANLMNQAELVFLKGSHSLGLERLVAKIRIAANQ